MTPGCTVPSTFPLPPDPPGHDPWDPWQLLRLFAWIMVLGVLPWIAAMAWVTFN